MVPDALPPASVAVGAPLLPTPILPQSVFGQALGGEVLKNQALLHGGGNHYVLLQRFPGAL